MRCPGLQLGLAACLAVAAFAGESALRRDGEFWVEEGRGSVLVPSNGNIRIASFGAVTVKGVAGSELVYIITKRVRARSEAEARRRLSLCRVRTSHQGKVTRLWLEGRAEAAELEIAAPQSSGEVMVETRAGTVDVSKFDGAVIAQTGGGRINIDQVSGDLVAKTAAGEISLGKIGGDSRCVSGGGAIRAATLHGQAFLETGGGDIHVQQVDGAVRCTTNGGGIHIAQAGNIVIADTAGGPIEVGYAKGMVTANNSAGGPIRVGSASGARCESAGGAIRLTSFGGGLKASTVVGSIIARFQTQPAEDSFLSTSHGDITVWIPSNLKVTVHAQNASYGGSNRIVCDFPNIAVKLAGASTIADGSLNGGGPLVKLAGTGGMIYIRREEK